MTTQTTEVQTLATLIWALDDLAKQAQSGHYAALVRPTQNALEIAVRAYKFYAGMDEVLEGAIASIRAGNPDEAVAHIQVARKIHAAWVGANLNDAGEIQA